MNDFPLPACCSPLDDRWPLPQPLPGALLISTRFDPALLCADDFTRCDIPSVKGVAKRQSEFLAGRICAREALRRLNGGALVPGIGEDRAPQWPAGCLGSITHGDGWAAAVVASSQDYRGLGLDVERLLSTERATRLAQEILTPAELQRLREHPEADWGRWVTLTFSLKESLFKALYPQVLVRFYFQDAELLDWHPDGSARLRLLTTLSAEWAAGSELDGQFCEFDGYLLSLVSVSGPGKRSA